MHISVVTVSYNVKDYLAQQLASIKHALTYWGGVYEIWVVDNASEDGTVQYIQAHHPTVRLVANAKNLGFARANNQALRVILEENESDAILLLNPDTVVATDAIARLVACMERQPDSGAVGPHLISSAGSYMPESRRALPTPAIAFFRLFGLGRLFPQVAAFTRYHIDLPGETDHEVAVLSGSCMLLRNTALHATGLLDERFFMYGEDIDMSHRLMLAGFTNYYCAGARVLHYKGRSSTRRGGGQWLASRYHFYLAMWIFAAKHLANRRNVLLPLITLGITLRAGIEVLLSSLRWLGLPTLEAAQTAAVFLGIKTFWQEAYAYSGGGGYPATFTWLAVPLYTALCISALAVTGAYREPYRIRRLLMAGALAFTAIATLSYLLPTINFSRFIVFSAVVVMVVAALANRLIVSRIKTGRWGFRRHTPRTAIVGDSEAGRAELMRVAQLLHTRPDVVGEVLGIVCAQPLAQTDFLWLGSPAQLPVIAKRLNLQQVVWCGGYDAGALLTALQHLGSDIHFYTLPTGATHLMGTTGIVHLGGG